MTAAQVMEVKGRLAHAAHLSSKAIRQEVRELLSMLTPGEIATLTTIGRAVIVEAVRLAPIHTFRCRLCQTDDHSLLTCAKK